MDFIVCKKQKASDLIGGLGMVGFNGDNGEILADYLFLWELRIDEIERVFGCCINIIEQVEKFLHSFFSILPTAPGEKAA